MNKQDVIEFFDRAASSWDAEMIKNDAIINKILDNTEIEEGQDTISDAFRDEAKSSDHIEIAVGYVSKASLEEYFTPNPYTVSVGKATAPPFSIMRLASINELSSIGKI